MTDFSGSLSAGLHSRARSPCTNLVGVVAAAAVAAASLSRKKTREVPPTEGGVRSLAKGTSDMRSNLT